MRVMDQPTVEGYFKNFLKCFRKQTYFGSGVKTWKNSSCLSQPQQEWIRVLSLGLDGHKGVFFQFLTVMFLLTMLSCRHVSGMTIPPPVTLNLLQFPWILRAPEITVSCRILPPDSSCLLNGLEGESDPGAPKLTDGHFSPHCGPVVATVPWCPFPNQPCSPLAALCSKPPLALLPFFVPLSSLFIVIQRTSSFCVMGCCRELREGGLCALETQGHCWKKDLM